MTSPYGFENKENGQRDWRDLAEQVRHLEIKVDDLRNRLDEHLHLLQEILDGITKDNGNDADWYDLYEDGDYD